MIAFFTGFQLQGRPCASLSYWLNFTCGISSIECGGSGFCSIPVSQEQPKGNRSDVAWSSCFPDLAASCPPSGIRTVQAELPDADAGTQLTSPTLVLSP